MFIIPVIDLRAGQAVRAIAGQRDNYQPLHSLLCSSPEPLAVVRAYRTLYRFNTVYIADLDAIENTGDNRAVISALLAMPELSDLQIWLDAGFASAEQLADWPAGQRLRPVFGSESQTDLAVLQNLLDQHQALNPLLSLDYKNGHFLGPPALLESPHPWPTDVIIMQLDRVGANQGPDQALPDIKNKRFFAAGGVRNRADLAQLASKGYAGVLVASALHNGSVKKVDIEAFMD